MRTQVVMAAVILPVFLTACSERFAEKDTEGQFGRSGGFVVKDARPEDTKPIENFQREVAALNSPSRSILGIIQSENDRIPQNYRGNITQIRSEKAVGGLVPTVWFVVFADQEQRDQPLEVRFENGKMTSTTRSLTGPDPVSEKPDNFDFSQVQVDSADALDQAMEASGHPKSHIHASSMRLDFVDGVPVWSVQLWGADDQELSVVKISAVSGKALP